MDFNGFGVGFWYRFGIILAIKSCKNAPRKSMHTSMSKKHWKLWQNAPKRVPKWKDNASEKLSKVDAKSTPENDEINCENMTFWSAESCNSTVRVIKNRGFVSFQKHRKTTRFFMFFEGWVRAPKSTTNPSKIYEKSMLEKVMHKWCTKHENHEKRTPKWS